MYPWKPIGKAQVLKQDTTHQCDKPRMVGEIAHEMTEAEACTKDGALKVFLQIHLSQRARLLAQAEIQELQS